MIELFNAVSKILFGIFLGCALILFASQVIADPPGGDAEGVPAPPVCTACTRVKVGTECLPCLLGVSELFRCYKTDDCATPDNNCVPECTCRRLGDNMVCK